jgi:hypothetical protein
MTAWRLARSGIVHAFRGRARLSACGLCRRSETLRGSAARPADAEPWQTCTSCLREMAA